MSSGRDCSRGPQGRHTWTPGPEQECGSGRGGTLTHWHSSQMRNAPRVASSWLSWMSTLITCTGWQVSCSLEFRSNRPRMTRRSEAVEPGHLLYPSLALGWSTRLSTPKPGVIQGTLVIISLNVPTSWSHSRTARLPGVEHPTAFSLAKYQAPGSFVSHILFMHPKDLKTCTMCSANTQVVLHG